MEPDRKDAAADFISYAIPGIKMVEYGDCTKTKGTSVGCMCSTELVCCTIVCNVK